MRSRLWPLYAGGLLGPFGGAMVTTMLPELAEGLHTSLATAASSLTVYLVPFAAIMLVSGTLAEHWGRARTIRWAYLVYALASLACALAPTAATFLGARAIQGAANAFTTPLLVAAISDLVGPTRLGRSLGVFGGMQAAGQAFAPLVGGIAAALDYRWAFVSAAAAAALWAPSRLPIRRRPSRPPRPPRSPRTPRTTRRRVCSAPRAGVPWPTGVSPWPARWPSACT